MKDVQKKMHVLILNSCIGNTVNGCLDLFSAFHYKLEKLFKACIVMNYSYFNSCRYLPSKL